MTAHAPILPTGIIKLFTGRSSNFQNNVGSQGYNGSPGSGDSQVHHVLPCGATSDTKEEYIDSFKVDAGTANWVIHENVDYDINAGHNLLGLPTRIYYATKFGTPLGITPAVVPKVIPGGRNWPCHTIAHNKYSAEAKVRTKKLWKLVKLAIKAHKPTSVKDIGQDLKDTSDDLREGLERVNRNRTPRAWREGEKDEFALYPFPP